MDHTAAISLYNHIQAHVSDSEKVTELFEQLCAHLITTYPAPESHMQAEADTYLQGRLVISDWDMVPPALIPIAMIKSVFAMFEFNPIHFKYCPSWVVFTKRYHEIILRSSLHNVKKTG